MNRIFILVILLLGSKSFAQQTEKLPNVILIITDDQGYGDFGFTGNPHIKTPTLDALAAESVRYTNYHVSPVCALTRASLMTGRYSLRTGVRDTYNGGAMMAGSELTIAELLKTKNYKTGIFGKWHLGDNYPMRPSDQGFDESLIHLAGGMGQVGDITTFFEGDRSYFDPVLWHNNQQEKYAGYCSDIFAEKAIKFIEANKDQPFFTYLSFNAPHTPLQVPDKYYHKYMGIDPSAGFGQDGKPFYPMSEGQKEDARKVYAMVENIDDNLNRLFKRLEELDLAENTIVIFMTDNGPQQQRYVGGLRGTKGNVFQGGIKVPLLIRYPNGFDGNRNVSVFSAHLDILPTLADLVGIELPKDRKIDGRSLLPATKDQNLEKDDRSYFSYWTRKNPELYQNIAIQKNGWKLVGNTDYLGQTEGFELFNMEEDPYEQRNLMAQESSKAMSLKAELDATYHELIAEENLHRQPLIEVGNAAENPIILNRNDASGERGIWDQPAIFGYWNVKMEAGTYDIRFKFVKPVAPKGKVTLEIGNQVFVYRDKSDGDLDILELKDVSVGSESGQLLPFYEIGGTRIFPFWVELTKTK